MVKYDLKYNIVEEIDERHQIVAIEPLERGYGYTIGNALRRVMLGYLYGAGITRVKINDVSHEFSPLKGIHEDAVELIQNLKGVNFKMTQKKVTIVTLDARGKGDGEVEVTAGDLKCPAGIEVVNKDHHLATLSEKKSRLTLELTVEYGQGYRVPEEKGKKPIGVILVDTNFSPVVLASYKVESTRVGQVTDLDRLLMDITTNGSLSPKEAIQQAAAILTEHFQLLAGETEVYQDNSTDEAVDAQEMPNKPEAKVYLEELNLPTRILNTLKKAGYETVSDLEDVDEQELKKIKNIGPKTLDLVMEKIAKAQGSQE